MKHEIINGDCLEEMRKMADESIDCIITDPPYGLGFMGKDWDAGLPQHEIWQEALRVTKTGCHMLCFGGTRTYHRLTCAIEDSGWVIRDCIMWLYGSGFPKARSCLKPAYEPIVLARKGKLATPLNIDDCRIDWQGERDRVWNNNYTNVPYDGGFKPQVAVERNPKGRWPANVILDEEAGEELGESSRFFYCAKASPAERNAGLDNFPLVDCSKIGQYKENPGRIAPKSSFPNKNHHPTVKPLKLMEYLIKLIAPQNGIILDPFMGSGSTLVAAKSLGFSAIGIEKVPEYCDIARARL